MGRWISSYLLPSGAICGDIDLQVTLTSLVILIISEVNEGEANIREVNVGEVNVIAPILLLGAMTCSISSKIYIKKGENEN